MKLNNILSSELPEIDNSIKECVNLGQWLLFKSKTTSQAGAESSFYLKVGQCIYKLSDSGKVVQEIEKPRDNLRIDELFYFSDIPKPRSLSNTPFLNSSISTRIN